MTPARWNEIIRTAAEQAVDECEGVEAVALRAATLAAEWVCEEMAMEEEAGE